jgi:hypothetical protein
MDQPTNEILPSIELFKETIEISGGRRLYNYRFKLGDEDAAPMTPADVVPANPAAESSSESDQSGSGA